MFIYKFSSDMGHCENGMGFLCCLRQQQEKKREETEENQNGPSKRKSNQCRQKKRTKEKKKKNAIQRLKWRIDYFNFPSFIYIYFLCVSFIALPASMALNGAKEVLLANTLENAGAMFQLLKSRLSTHLSFSALYIRYGICECRACITLPKLLLYAEKWCRVAQNLIWYDAVSSGR